MTKGQIIIIDGTQYTIELIGPVTTLLLRNDGVLVHAPTNALRLM